MEKKERIILIVCGVIKLFDGVTDVLYLATEMLYFPALFWILLSFILAPIFIVSILFTISILVQVCETGNKLWKATLIVASTILIGESFGIASIVYGLAYSCKNPGIEKGSVMLMCKIAAVIFALFESIPEIIIQTYNSGMMKSSSPIFIVSCLCSGLNIISSFLRSFYSYDQQEQHKKTIEMMSAAKYLSREVWRNTDITLEQFN